MTAREHSIDWERIEAEFRAGRLSNVEIAKKHSITEGAIRRRAKAQSWERDLAPVVRQGMQRAIVRASVRAEALGAESRIRTDAEVVAIAISDGVQMVMTQRVDFSRTRAALDVLTNRLIEAITKGNEIEAEIEAETKDDSSPQRGLAMMRAVALPTLIVAAKDLLSAKKMLVPMERQSFGLPDLVDPTPPDAGADHVSPSDEMLAAARERIRSRHDPKPAEA